MLQDVVIQFLLLTLIAAVFIIVNQLTHVYYMKQMFNKVDKLLQMLRMYKN